MNLFRAQLSLVLLCLVITPSLVTPLVHTQVEYPRGEVLFVTGAQWTPPSTWNPMSPSQTWGTQSFGGFLYLPLFQYIPGLDMWIPIIAERFEIPDNNTIRVKIRQEARWSDGKPITAHDVEFTYNLSIALGTGPAAGADLYLDRVKAVDEKTVEFYINPNNRNYFMFVWYSLQLTPVPKHIYEFVYQRLGNQIVEWRNCGGVCEDVGGLNLPQVVSGPYKLEYFDELRVIYRRFDDWWGRTVFGLPGPRYLIHRIYLSNEQIILDLMQGNVDWGGIFVPMVWQLFKQNVGTYFKAPPYFRPNQILVLYINNNIDYLRDPSLRRAIAYAIDYKEIIEKAWYGYTTQASMSFVFEYYPQYRPWINTTLASAYWGTSNAKVITNKTHAATILDEAGYRDLDGDGYRETPQGDQFSITILVPTGWTDWMIAADLIAGDLQEVGINAQANPVDYGAYWGYLIGGTYTALIGWLPAPSFSHPWDTYRYLLDPRLTPPAGNWGWYNNTRVVSLIDECSKATTYEDLMHYYTEIQRLIYEEIPAIALVYAPQWYVYSTRVWQGWPNEDNPWWTEVAPYKEYSLALWVLFSLNREGRIQSPSWSMSVDKGGLLIPNRELMEALAEAAGLVFITPPQTDFNATITTPKDQVPQPAGAGGLYMLLITFAVIAGVVVGAIVVVRLVLKRRT